MRVTFSPPWGPMLDSVHSQPPEFPVEGEKQCLGREIIGTIRRQFLDVLPISAVLSVI
jgi:hypothetical protein